MRLPQMKHIRSVLLAATTLALLGGCTNTTGEIGSYLDRRTSWMSFLSADDIRQACVPGAPERYRFVYYANASVQTRIYDLTETEGRQGTLRARVLVGNRIPSTIFADQIEDLFKPIDTNRPVGLADATAIIQALDKDGFTATPPDGKTFHSWEYFWLVTGCRDGKIVFNGWTRPDPRFAALTFPKELFARDPAAQIEPIRHPGPSWQEPDAHVVPRAGVGKETSGFIRYDLIVGPDRVRQGTDYE